jgi:hypothetical protein
MKNNNKGQAAIEFLVTYGWAIMAAMVVIGALTYFGMTNPSTSLPDKCIFSNAFSCKDYQIQTDKTLGKSIVRLQMINSFGQTIYGNMTAECTNDNSLSFSCTMNGNPSLPYPEYLEPDDIINITCECANTPDTLFNVKEKAKVKITINYKKNPDASAYNQVSLGEVYATVQDE